MSIFGLLILNSDTGKLIYERDYTDCKFGLMRDPGRIPPSKQPAALNDSESICDLIYNLMKLQESSFDKSPESHSFKIFGFTEILLERSNNFPLALVIFYKGFESQLIQDIAPKLLDVFIEKYESKALALEVNKRDFQLADKYFLPVYEDLVIQTIKYFVLDLSNLNLYVPWIYICLLTQPKVPLVQDSFRGSFFLPVESVSITPNKAKIM